MMCVFDGIFDGVFDTVLDGILNGRLDFDHLDSAATHLMVQCNNALNHLPKSLFFAFHRRIMATCAPKFTFLDQKGTDFPNLGTQNSTVTFFS